MHIIFSVLAILAFIVFKSVDFIKEMRNTHKKKKSKKKKSSTARLAKLLTKSSLGEEDLDAIDDIFEDMESELEDDSNDGGEVEAKSSTDGKDERNVIVNKEDGIESEKKGVIKNKEVSKVDKFEKQKAEFHEMMEKIKNLDSLDGAEMESLTKFVKKTHNKNWSWKQDYNRQMVRLWGKWIKTNQITKLKVDFFNDYYFEDVYGIQIDGVKYGSYWDNSIESYYDKLISEKIRSESDDSYQTLLLLAESKHNGNSSHIIQAYIDNHNIKASAQKSISPISVSAKIIAGEDCYYYGELSWVIQRKWQGSPYLDFDNASAVKVYVVKDRIELLGEAVGHHTIWLEHILESAISSPDNCPGSLFTIYVRGGKPVFITGDRKQIIDLASVVYSLSSDSQKEMVPENSALEEDSVAVKKEESVLGASPEVEIQPSLQTMNSNQVVDVLERIANVKALIPRNGINKQWIYKQGKVLVHEVYLDGSNSDNNLAADLIFDDNGGAKLLLFTRQYDVNRTKEILEDKTIWGDVNNPAFMGDRYVYKEFPVGTSDEEIARYMEDFVNKMVAYRGKHSL